MRYEVARHQRSGNRIKTKEAGSRRCQGQGRWVESVVELIVAHSPTGPPAWSHTPPSPLPLSPPSPGSGAWCGALVEPPVAYRARPESDTLSKVNLLIMVAIESG